MNGSTSTEDIPYTLSSNIAALPTAAWIAQHPDFAVGMRGSPYDPMSQWGNPDT